ncbi:MAG: hypothetical protein DMG41_25125 [Acidobacteria bacterium]|nr:MAG: hypothetical protein DMG41_25125 [Acidobacteriota bacterium]
MRIRRYRSRLWTNNTVRLRSRPNGMGGSRLTGRTTGSTITRSAVCQPISLLGGGAMASPNQRLVQPATKSEADLGISFDGLISQAALSTALVSVFRGKFCDAILPNRKATTFNKEQVIYEVGDQERTFFFLQDGFVKVGTVTSDGHELIYDVRKGGDVVGELCASEPRRPDRAVALEQTDAVPVPYQDVMEVVRKQPDLLERLVDVFCRALTKRMRK